MDVVKTHEGTIFYTEGAKLRRSIDNGLTVTTLVTPSPSFAINAICSVSDAELYIATDDNKVYISNNMGNTWQQITTGLPAGANIYSLKIINGTLYAGTYAYGVFYYEPDAIGIQNGNEIANSFSLKQNYPNPFNPTTKIAFSIPKSSFVNITVYDMLGKEVNELVNGIKAEGNYEVNFDASTLAGGVYFYKLQTEDFSEIKKMTLIK